MANLRESLHLARSIQVEPPKIHGSPEAGPSKRLGADLLDLTMAAFILSIFNQQNGGITPTAALLGFFIIFPAYYVICDAFGGTIAKHLLGLRVVDAETGKKIGLWRSLRRGLTTLAAILTRLAPVLLLWGRKTKGRSAWLQDNLSNSTIVDIRRR